MQHVSCSKLILGYAFHTFIAVMACVDVSLFGPALVILRKMKLIPWYETMEGQNNARRN